MIEVTIGFFFSVFLAGILMFLAPCTLPLVPAYLAFISGVKTDDLRDPQKVKEARKKILKNGIAFVIGFSFIFTLFGMLAGFFGSQIGQYQQLLTILGGGFIILFGLMMLGVIKIDALMSDHRINLPSFLTPGEPKSALLIGSTFAVGWTPCVGPILASVLLLAATEATVVSGGVLLLVFSAGLAVPFLLTALLYGRAATAIPKMAKASLWVSRIGGVFLIFIGVLLLTGNFGLTVQYGYQLFDFLHYDALLEYL